MQKREILFLEPKCTHNIWGGTRLREEFGYKEEGNEFYFNELIRLLPNSYKVVKL